MSLEDILIYWRVVWKRIWLIGLLIGSTIGTMLLMMYTAKPVYVASVRFQVRTPPSSDVTLFSGFRAPSAQEEIAYTRAEFIDVLTSLAVAWDVVEELGVNMQGEDLHERITVEDIANSTLTKVSVSADDPQLAADLVNKLIEVALQRYGQIRAQPATMARQFIQQQLEIVGKDLDQAEQDLVMFQVEHKVGVLDTLISSQQSLIRSLNLERDQALAEGRTEAAAAYDRLIARREAELQEQIQLSTTYSDLVRKVNQLQGTYNLLLEKQTEATLKENEILSVSFIQVIGEARVPTKPKPPIRWSIVALGGVVSLITGVMGAFIWEYVERSRQEGAMNVAMKPMVLENQ